MPAPSLEELLAFEENVEKSVADLLRDGFAAADNLPVFSTFSEDQTTFPALVVSASISDGPTQQMRDAYHPRDRSSFNATVTIYYRESVREGSPVKRYLGKIRKVFLASQLCHSFRHPWYELVWGSPAGGALTTSMIGDTAADEGSVIFTLSFGIKSDAWPN